MPSRRGFLGFFGAAVASATLDPERLLWVPGAKVYSIPVPRIATDAKTMNAQMEYIRPQLVDLWLHRSVLWERIAVGGSPFRRAA